MYTNRKFYLAPDPESSGPNFAALDEAFGDDETIVDNSNDTKPDTSIDNDNPEDDIEDKVSIEPVVAKEEKVDDNVEEEGFKLPGEEGYTSIADTEEVNNDNEESTWIGLAKQQGVEITDDSIEAYTEALKQQKTQEIAQAIEAVRREQFQFDVAKYPERERLYLEHVLNGGTIDDFEKPTQIIDNYLQMETSELIKADLLARNFTETMADAEIQLMSEKMITINKGTQYEQVISVLELEDSKLRTNLQNKRNEVIEEAIYDRQIIKQREQEILKERFTKENTQFKEELSRTKTFFDIPVSDKQREIIAQKWESGELRKLFAENPSVAVKAAMQYYFGDQALKQLKTMEYDAGADRFRRKLSNVPPKTEGSSGHGSRNRQTSGGEGPNFENLQQSLGD